MFKTLLEIMRLNLILKTRSTFVSLCLKNRQKGVYLSMGWYLKRAKKRFEGPVFRWQGQKSSWTA